MQRWDSLMCIFYIFVTKLLTNTHFGLAIRTMRTKTIFRKILLKNRTLKPPKMRVRAVIFRKFFLKYVWRTLFFKQRETPIQTALNPFLTI